MRVIVRLQYWMKIVQYWFFFHLNYSVFFVYFVSLVCVGFFFNFGSFKCFGIKCGIYFAEQIYIHGWPWALFHT